MDKILIDNFFKRVKKKDVVYFAGDLSWDKNVAEHFLQYIKHDNIEFHFIRGNHDRRLQDSMLKKYCASISLYKDIQINNQKITICHYPMYSWSCSHFGAWLLHGHHHRNTEKQFPSKIMNVGIDVNNFSPVSFEEINIYMKSRPDNWDYIKKNNEKEKE